MVKNGKTKDLKPGKLEWKGFMSDKISDVIAGKKQIIAPPKAKFMKKVRAGTEDYHENRKLFNKTVNELKDLVTPHLGREVKLQMENAKMRALGGKADRVKSMPCNMLRDHQKRTAKKEEKRASLEKELGVKLFEGKINANANVEVRKKSAAVQKRKARSQTAATFSVGKLRQSLRNL